MNISEIVYLDHRHPDSDADSYTTAELKRCSDARRLTGDHVLDATHIDTLCPKVESMTAVKFLQAVQAVCWLRYDCMGMVVEDGHNKAALLY